jgi:hypothetical protein
VSPLLALIALHGMDEAITQVYPEARVITYADDCVVLHEERSVLEHCQHLFMTWLAEIGLTLNVTKTHIRHTLEGDQPGMDFLGFHIRQYRVGIHQSGKGPRGHQRLGFKTLIKPTKVNVKAHLAELGQIIRRGRAWPQAALIRQLNPKIRGWANYYRTWVSQATFSRVDHLTWVKLRHWACRRHPNASAGWVYDRYWPRRDSRRVFAHRRPLKVRCISPPIVRSPASGTPRSQAIGALTMGIGYIGAPDGDATRWSAPDWPPCSNGRAGAVPIMSCSSNMMTSLRLTISVGIDEIPAIAISKLYMDTAMMRKLGNMVSTSRSVCVTRIRTLRSGVHGNGHAPFWSSGRRSDPPIDCSRML